MSVLDADAVLAGRYRLVRLLATGGMGQVWQATDTVLGRPVAVKLLRAEHADRREFLLRFAAEARAAASISHPNVVAVYDYGEHSAGGGLVVPFLVMELVPGTSLAQELRSRHALPPDEVMRVVAQVALGLGAAHRGGIVHRDVKPANLLITPDGTVKITDFGIASAGGATGLTRVGSVIGTAQFLSPEQAAGHSATTRSDLYSLGVVAYTALAGQPPFSAENETATALAHLQQAPRPLPPSVPAAVSGLVMALLAKDPAVRPAPAEHVAGLATAAAEGAPGATAVLPVVDDRTAVLAAPAPPADATRVLPAVAVDEPLPPRRRNRRGLLAALLVLVVLAAAGIAYALSGTRNQVAVPDVHGKSVASATKVLRSYGFTVSSAHASGTVTSTRPTAGADAQRGSTVTLQLATPSTHSLSPTPRPTTHSAAPTTHPTTTHSVAPTTTTMTPPPTSAAATAASTAPSASGPSAGGPGAGATPVAGPGKGDHQKPTPPGKHHKPHG